MSTVPSGREAFVENAVWIGLVLACEGQDQSNLKFAGNLVAGTVDCNDGQGSDFVALWDAVGVAVVACDFCQPKHALALPSFPEELQPLLRQVSAHRIECATGGLWIVGEASDSTLEEPESGSVLGLIERMCGPALATNQDGHRAARLLLDAVAQRARTITSDVADCILRRDVIETAMKARHCSALAAARPIATMLQRFGLEWPDLEAHVAERWPAGDLAPT